MDDKLKTCIQWTIYVIVTGAIVFFLISLVITMIKPTCFPNIDISGFENHLTNAAVFVSFLSAGLGAFSVWQANSSSKQSVEIIKKLNEIENEQLKISNNILSIRKTNINKKYSTESGQNWDQEPDFE